MGSKSGGKSPDYVGVARQQGTEDRNTALFNAGLNRPNQYGPTGSVEWTLRPGADPMNPKPGDFIQKTTLSPAEQQLLQKQQQATGQNLQLSQAAGNAAAGQIGQGPNLSGLPALSGAPGTIQQTAQAGAPATSIASAGNVQSQLAPTGSQQTTFGNTGSAQTSVADAGNVTRGIQSAGPMRTQIGANAAAPVTSVSDQAVQRGLSTDNLPDLTNSYADARRSVEQALMARQEPMLSQGEEAARVRLLNSGIEKGSVAWDREMERLGRTRTDSEMAAILAGGQEQSRLASMEQAARSQMFGERQTQGQFANSAAAQAFQQGLAGGQFANQAQAQTFGQQATADAFANQAQQQQFGQNQAQATFGNQAQAQAYGQNLASGQFANAGQQQNFAQAQTRGQFANDAQATAFQQGLASGQFANQAQGQQFAQNQAQAGFQNEAQQQTFQQRFSQDQLVNDLLRRDAQLNNSARGQGFQEASYLQNLPIQQYLQLLSAGRGGAGGQGNSLEMPGFVQAGAQPADYMTAASQAGRDAQAKADREAASTNATIGAIASIAAAFFSDRRLKSNVKRVGTHKLGIGRYTWTWADGSPGFGVMAQEVQQVRPDAVVTMPNGYLGVRYDLIGGF